MVLKMSDWVVPGHGPMFKAKKGVEELSEEMKLISKFKEGVKDLKCKKCKRVMVKKDRCLCRQWLCYRCCECGMDCELCYCRNHRKN